jgi:SDR family mycofactocin-dependent oxidoreductase
MKMDDSASESGVTRRMFMMSGAGALAMAATQQSALAQSGGATEAGQTWPGQLWNAPLAGRVAVVTGAARGIGRSIAVDMAANGADIVGIDITSVVSPIVEYPASTPSDLEETGRLVREHGRKFLAITVDIRNLSALRSAAERAEQSMGKIDIVVANAGIQAFQPILEMDDKHWDDVLHTNLFGTANTVRAFAPHLVKQGKGRMILVASMQGRYGTKNGSAYSASKWGIIGLMKSAALELGKYKITVNTIEPGLIDTAMTRNPRRWSEAVGESMTTPPPENPTEEQVTKARVPKSPLGVPWLTPEEVAPVAVFLASDAAAMVTGACYDVNAGDSAHDLG